MGLAVLLFALTAALAVAAAPALASEAAWTVASSSSPTNFVPNDETGDDTYVLKAVNTGEESTEGSRIEVIDTLPSGLTATSISGEDLGNEQALSCKLTPRLGCSYESYEVAPGDVLQVTVVVEVKPGAISPAVNAVTVSGGGASSATSTDPTTLSSTPAHFGVSGFTATTSSAQAGAGSNLTAGFALNDTVAKGEYQPVALPKDVEITLPSGFLANLQSGPRCTSAQVQEETCGGGAVGVVFASVDSAVGGPLTAYSSVIYNVVPEPGEVATLMFKLGGGWVRVEVDLRLENDYRMSLRTENIPETMGLLAMEMTLDAADVGGKGTGPDHVSSETERYFGPSYGNIMAPSPFQEPGACGPPAPVSSLSADSWAQPGMLSDATSEGPLLSGCQRLEFDPKLVVSPDVSLPATPSGYTIGLHVPRREGGPEGLESADPRDVTLTMPVGVGFSLSGTTGLESCTEAQFALLSNTPEECPNASKVGQVEILTPLLAYPMHGSIFLASPYANPFASLLAVYLVAEEPTSGMLVKLTGELHTNPTNGQLSLTIHELPQLHLEDLKLHFFGESTAPLTTPSSCGLFTAVSSLVSWSTGVEAIAESSFEINDCTSRFEPSLQVDAGGGSNGSYESLLLIASQTSQEEQMQSLSLEVPDTLESALVNATPCEWEQAENGTCPASSRVGGMELTVGLGPHQIYAQGNAYVTGPYEGAQAGLSIVFPLIAAPLDLGTVVIRAAMQPEPASGQASIVLDSLPTLVDGIPLWMDDFALLLEPGGGFTVDPTTCKPFALAGNVTSTQGLSAPVSATLPAPAGCKPSPVGTGTSENSSSSAPSSTAPIKPSEKPKFETVCHFVKHGKKAKRKRVCKLEKVPKHKPKKAKRAAKKTTKATKRVKKAK